MPGLGHGLGFQTAGAVQSLEEVLQSGLSVTSELAFSREYASKKNLARNCALFSDTLVFFACFQLSCWVGFGEDFPTIPHPTFVVLDSMTSRQFSQKLADDQFAFAFPFCVGDNPMQAAGTVVHVSRWAISSVFSCCRALADSSRTQKGG